MKFFHLVNRVISYFKNVIQKQFSGYIPCIGNVWTVIATKCVERVFTEMQTSISQNLPAAFLLSRCQSAFVDLKRVFFYHFVRLVRDIASLISQNFHGRMIFLKNKLLSLDNHPLEVFYEDLNRDFPTF